MLRRNNSYIRKESVRLDTERSVEEGGSGYVKESRAGSGLPRKMDVGDGGDELQSLLTDYVVSGPEGGGVFSNLGTRAGDNI
jgi:hypothetical protein